MTSTLISEKAQTLHQQARELGAEGKYDQAIAQLKAAHDLAPTWPYPVYDLAFTYLLMRDYDNAREYYKKTIELSPRGFFTAITAHDTLLKEAQGVLPEGTYAAYMSLEWTDDINQKSQIVNALVTRLPMFAPGWKEYALMCDDENEKLRALDKGLAADPDRETEGILYVNKAITLYNQGETLEAIRLLQDMTVRSETTLANEALAKQVLASMQK